MSMILDALQRADRERRQQEPAVPSLDDTPAPPPKRRRNLWWVLGAVALVIALGLATVMLTRTAPDPEIDEAETRPRVEAPAEIPESDTEPEEAATENTATDPAETPDIARLYQSPVETDASVAELYRDTEKQAAETTAAETAPAPDRSPAADTEPRPQNEPTETAATSGNTDDTNAGTDTAEPQKPEEPAIASIRDLPWNLQQSLPSLNYQSHDYREDGVSQVVINGKTLRGGERISQELVLERIDRDGVVLRYRGYPFKLNALSSWVNM